VENGNPNMAVNGLYIVKDEYFSDFPSVKHMDNKHESRPYYMAIKGESGIFWMVPISHQVDKYREKIKKDEARHGNSLYAYICNIKGSPRAVLTGNVVPVTANYLRPFNVNGKPFIIKDSADIKAIKSKVGRYIALARQGKIRPAVDILEIEKKLINRQQNSSYII
jgi:hypothetical protein